MALLLGALRPETRHATRAAGLKKAEERPSEQLANSRKLSSTERGRATQNSNSQASKMEPGCSPSSCSLAGLPQDCFRFAFLNASRFGYERAATACWCDAGSMKSCKQNTNEQLHEQPPAALLLQLPSSAHNMVRASSTGFPALIKS